MSPSIIKEKFDAYLKSFNTHRDEGLFGEFYADNFTAHWAGCPPLKNKAETLALFAGGLAFFQETIHPTWLQFGERSVAMEAQMHSQAMQDIDFPFPFTGKTYKKGEKFVYPLMYVLFFLRAGFLQSRKAERLTRQ